LIDRLSSVTQNNKYLLKEIVEYIDNKNIYIVGEIANLSDVIINAPILVRLNGTHSWGKCDIWFSDDDQLEYFSYPQKYIIRSPKDGDDSSLLKDYPASLKNKTIFMDSSVWGQMVAETKISFPLTETVAAYWFLKHTSSNITLLNYNFSTKHTNYSTNKTIYLDKKYTPELDKEYLSSQDRVTLKRIVI